MEERCCVPPVVAAALAAVHPETVTQTRHYALLNMTVSLLSD